MIEFETIDKFMDYIPNCIICGKKLTLYFNLYNESIFTRRQGYFHYIEMKYDDEFLISKNKLFNLSFDSKTNLIIDGADIFNESMRRSLTVLKKCKTCNFHIQAICRGNAIKKYTHIPSLELHQINIKYMMSKHKIVSIMNYVAFSSGDMNNSYMSINDRYIAMPIYINLSKYSGIKQLNKRIKTLITFQ